VDENEFYDRIGGSPRAVHESEAKLV